MLRLLRRLLLALPPPGSAAWEDESAFLDGKADFIRRNMAAEGRNDGSIYHIGQYGGLQPGGIGIHQIEEGIPGEDLCGQFNKREDAFFYFPYFPFRSSAIGRRVHNNGIISIAPADFPLHEFHAVIHQPSDGGIPKAGGDGIFLCPGDHAFGSVHMGDAGAGFGSGQGGTAGISE